VTQAIDVEALRAEFPFTNEWSYLNHAAVGPFPKRTVEAVREWAESIANAPVYVVSDHNDIPAATAAQVASLAGSSADQVAWVPSLADGMNLLANGIDYRDGDNVLIPVDEFPSVVYPFLNLQRRGVELRYVQKNAAGRTDIGMIEAAMDDRTRALAISHVEYMDGYRNDLKAVGALCRGRGVELFVDATQSLGTQEIDLANSGVTAIVAHGYKWLMAGFGIGVAVFAPGAVDRIQVTYAGRLSVNASYEDHEYTLDWRDGAARYQTGGLNVLGITAMHASLGLVTQVGPARSAAHAIELLDRLAEGVQAAGYQVASDLDPAHRSQIMTFTSGDHQQDGEIVAQLERAKVSVTLRGRGVRVSPYFYNSLGDIDQLLEALPNR
jgi:selenocysteine lyase/cysteine desulfurase